MIHCVVPKNQRNRVLLDLLKTSPCVDCGGKFPPAAMDFDHLDPKTKRYDISQMMSCSQEILIREIAKCDLVCSNCHRNRTQERLGLMKEAKNEQIKAAQNLLAAARERLVDKKQVMAVLSVSRATLDRWRKDPDFPVCYERAPGCGRRYWRLSAIEDYIIKHTHNVVAPIRQ